MASPGAGKTSLIEHTVRALSGSLRLAVIDGDIATSLDADRAAAAGATAVQINTGGECHLDAVMVQGALHRDFSGYSPLLENDARRSMQSLSTAVERVWQPAAAGWQVVDGALP